MKDRGKFERSTGGMKDGKYLRGSTGWSIYMHIMYKLFKATGGLA